MTVLMCVGGYIVTCYVVAGVYYAIERKHDLNGNMQLYAALAPITVPLMVGVYLKDKFAK